MVLEKREKICTTQKSLNDSVNFVSGIPVFDKNGNLKLIICFSSWEVVNYDDLIENYNKLKVDNENLINEINRLVRKDYITDNLIGESKKTKDAARLLQIFSASGVPAYVYGDKGSGKKFITHIAYESLGSVYDYNCYLLGEDTIENELFGNSEKQGVLTSMGYKTVIIHDIDLLTPKLQEKLIDFIKCNKVIVVGISKYSLEDLKNENKITDNFYYLFKTYQVHIYPLNERPEDLKAYIEYYLEFFNKKYSKSVYFSTRALNCLLSYKWQENINEVKYTIERIILTTENERVDVFNLPKEFSDSSTQYFSETDSLKDMLEFYEKNIITRVYEEYKTTVEVAKRLGISQPSAVRKIKKYVTDK
jgi:TyrR family helix-turn-helix protein